MTPEKKKFR